ncbi:MAG: SDR family oxidoreductase [Anaerolineaceae bacterium]|nr:SDR family oxidoreductase [Anaerolineaceae bacterium]
MILVVGATGQLGTLIVNKLKAKGQPVRVFVRENSNYQHLVDSNTEVAFGDLRDFISLKKATKGVDVVMSTANAVIPRGPYSFEEIEGKGYLNLIQASKENGVKQFILISVPVSKMDDQIPLLHYRRLTEKRLIESGMTYTIIRGSIFMEQWLALIGSTLPLRKEPNATLQRPYWFSKLFMKLVGGMIEKMGRALLAGDGHAKHAIVAANDVAEFMINSIDHPVAKNAILHVGGPQVLSTNDIVETYGKVLGKKVKPIHTPIGMFALMTRLLKPFSEAAANLMGLNWMVGSTDTYYKMDELSKTFNVQLTSMDRYLKAKLSM